MAGQLDILIESERRGLDLSVDEKELIIEARRRGMVPGDSSMTLRTSEMPTGGVDVMAEGLRRGGIGAEIGITGTGNPLKRFFDPGAENPGTALAIPMALGTAGGVVGQKIAGPIGAGTLSGVGAVAGRQINSALDLEPPLDAKEALKTFALSAIGEAGARFVFQSPASPEAQRRLAAFKALNVDPKLTDVVESRLPAATERFVSQMPFGGGVIAKKFGTQAKQLSAAAEDYFLEKVGPSSDAMAIGFNTRTAVEKEKARTGVIANSRYDYARRLANGQPEPVKGQVRGVLPPAGGETVLPSERNPFGGRPPTQRESVERTLEATRPDPAPFVEPADPLMSQARPATAEPFATGQVQRLGTVAPAVTPGPVRVPVGGLAKAARDLLSGEMLLAPKDQDAALIGRLKDYLAQADKGAMKWNQADAWRKNFGENIDRGELLSGRKTGVEKKLHAALAGDMEAAAQSSGNTELLTAWRDARTYWEHRAAVLRDSKVSEILKTAPEKVVALLDLRSGPTAIANAKEAINDPVAWNAIRRHVLEGVMDGAVDERAKGIFGAVISDAKLAAQEKKFGPGALAMLLEAGETRAAFDNIRTVAKAIHSGERAGSAAQSITAQNLAFRSVVGAAGGSVGAGLGFLKGGPVGAVAGFSAGSTVSLLLLPPVIAKILTSQTLTKVAASPAFSKVATDMRLGGALSSESVAALARLGALLMAEQIGGARVDPARVNDLAERR